jgi:hypothetical protein
MFRRQTLHCSKCDSTAVRRSRWLSHDEKARNRGRQPVRCNDCGHRFLADDSRSPQLPIAGAVGAASLLAGLLAVAFLNAENPPADLPPLKAPDKPAQAAAGLGPVSPAELQAAEAGDAEAQVRVASALLADPELNFAYSGKAIGFLEAAAEHGNTRAMLRLGMLYRKGVGALQNFNRAAKWLEKAAVNGDPQAMLEFGRLYREGVGVPQDPVRAYVWFNRAAAARDQDAPLERQAVARLLSPEDLHRAQEASAQPEVPPPAAPLTTTATAPRP